MRDSERVSQTLLRVEPSRPSHEEARTPSREPGARSSSPAPAARSGSVLRPPLRGVPPPPPARVTPRLDALLASVRLDGRGELIAATGDSQTLAELTAYAMQLMALVRAELALDPFAALHAELAGHAVLLFEDAGDMVGVLLRSGSEAQELAQQLGV